MNMELEGRRGDDIEKIPCAWKTNGRQNEAQSLIRIHTFKDVKPGFVYPPREKTLGRLAIYWAGKRSSGMGGGVGEK